MTTTGSDPPTQPRERATVHVRREADDIVSLYLRGEFDAFNASEITDHALKALAAEKHLVLDLSDTTFIDASRDRRPPHDPRRQPRIAGGVPSFSSGPPPSSSA